MNKALLEFSCKKQNAIVTFFNRQQSSLAQQRSTVKKI